MKQFYPLEEDVFRMKLLLIVLFLLVGCGLIQKRDNTPNSATAKSLFDANAEVLILRTIYSSCKAHLASEGTGRLCEKISTIPGDDKIKILARVILDDFRLTPDAKPVSAKTSKGVMFLAFMRMQAERYLRGDIGWNELDYSILTWNH